MDTADLRLRTMAAQWYTMVKQNSYYASAWKIPYVVGDSTGTFLFVSTAHSSRVYAENMLQIQQGQVVLKPFWFFFEVWQFREMALFNMGSFLDGRYH